MATRKQASAKEKPEWKALGIAEFAQDDGKKVWRSQKVLSGDGKRYLSIRAFAVKADGTEQVTNSGFMVPFDENAYDTLVGIRGLFKAIIALAEPLAEGD